MVIWHASARSAAVRSFRFNSSPSLIWRSIIIEYKYGVILSMRLKHRI